MLTVKTKLCKFLMCIENVYSTFPDDPINPGMELICEPE